MLRILDQHRGQQIRAVGRLHSWSDAVLADGVLLDLRLLNKVELGSDGDQLVATVGAGCQISRIQKELGREGADAAFPGPDHGADDRGSDPRRALTVRGVTACRTMWLGSVWRATTRPLERRSLKM